MQKLFENWRGYLNEASRPYGEKKLPANEDNWPQIKAEYEDHYLRFREKFIKAVLVDRKDSLAKLFKKDTEKNKVSLPVTFLVRELTNFLKNVKLTLMLTYKDGKPDPSRDPDRNYQGGPAYYDWKTGIGFENFLNKWYNVPIEGTGWSYESVVYHELGHAMEHGLFLALKKASKIKSKLDDPSIFDISAIETQRYLRSMLGIAPRKDQWEIFVKKSKPDKQWRTDKGLSVQQYKKLITIAPGLKDKFSYDHFHKELPWEFYASLKGFSAHIGREIIPLDIQVFCAMKSRQTRGTQIQRGYYKNLLEEWYEFLPTKLKKTIDDTSPEKLRDRYDRLKWHIQIQKLAKKLFSMAEFLEMLDCSKDPNYVVQVLRSLY
jgi:hypothetical protein